MIAHSFSRDQLKGFFFLLGGVSIFFFSLDVMVPLFRLLLIAFSLGLIAYGLIEGHMLKVLYTYFFSRQEQEILFIEKNIHGLFFTLSGILLFLYAAGILFELFHIFVAILALLLIFYGLKETGFLAWATKKIKEYEAVRKD
jgi:uncharacterized membrane protein